MEKQDDAYWFAVIVMLALLTITALMLTFQSMGEHELNLKEQELREKKEICSILTEREQMNDTYCAGLFSPYFIKNN